MLRYVGDGAALPDVPARDIDEWELAERGLSADVLVATGLYVREGAASKPSKKAAADAPPVPPEPPAPDASTGG